MVVVDELEEGVDHPVVEVEKGRLPADKDIDKQSTPSALPQLHPVDTLSAVEAKRSNNTGAHLALHPAILADQGGDHAIVAQPRSQPADLAHVDKGSKTLLSQLVPLMNNPADKRRCSSYKSLPLSSTTTETESSQRLGDRSSQTCVPALTVDHGQLCHVGKNALLQQQRLVLPGLTCESSTAREHLSHGVPLLPGEGPAQEAGQALGVQ